MWASGMLNFLTWGVVMQILALELQMYTKLHARFMLKKQNTVLQNNTQKVTWAMYKKVNNLTLLFLTIWILLFCTYFDEILFNFREGEGGRKRGKHQCLVAPPVPLNCGPGAWSATQAYALTGNLNGDTLVHRPAGTQSTEPHQPGLLSTFLRQLKIVSNVLKN